LVTVLTLVWLYLENQSMEKISNHAWYTFWYVLPTLPMFIAFPLLLPKLGFWPTLISSILITMASFGGFAILLRRFGIELYDPAAGIILMPSQRLLMHSPFTR
jgi:hypothetical protein